MEIEILRYKKFDTKQWALACCNLLEYLETLKEDFYEFQIQRRIVNNAYLNTIYDTIVKGEPIPAITLEVKDRCFGPSAHQLDGNSIEILDGLQRTFRLWTIYYIYKLVKKHSFASHTDLLSFIRSNSECAFLQEVGFVNMSFLRSLFVPKDGELYLDTVIDAFKSYSIIVELWIGLTDEEIIDKMLVLNAGQKSVTSTHQFELLFLHFFDKDQVKYNSNIHIWREKEPGYFNVKSGKKREVGDYTLSSIVISLQSFVLGKPMRIDPVNNIGLKSRWDDDINSCTFAKLALPDNLSRFIELLYEFDTKLASKNREYISWFGKDTTLSGLFAGIGKFIKDRNVVITSWDELEQAINSLLKNPILFDLVGYKKAYDDISSSKVNVGNVVRKAIARFCENILLGKTISWNECFSINSSDND